MTDYSPQAYEAQLQAKVALTQEQFAPYEISSPLQVISSPVQHYRMRAEFRVWHEGEDLYYIMFDQQTKERYRVDQFPVGSSLINEMMPLLLDQIRPNEVLRRKLFQVDYLSSMSGELVISLLYHRPLGEDWAEQARALRAWCAEQGYHVEIIGRARKQKVVLDTEYVTERLTVHDQTYLYRQVENSFTQPNGKVAEKMLEWAVEVTRDSDGDLLELYCGNGNFSVALAQNFRQVLATELAKPSVEAAQWNIQANAVGNLKIARLSAEEFTQAMKGERTFRRLEQQQIELGSYDFQTVLVDPPRAGMDEDSVEMIRAYQKIVYISCNPQTLAMNLDQLASTHQVTQIALFDQFPYTDHREVGVVLSQRD